ncbi:MAG: DUF6443 domain-containing protein [Bacteroidota bacterium]
MAIIRFASLYAQRPTSSQNYVIESAVKSVGRKTPGSLLGLPVDSVNKKISYFDGLGRPLQTVQWQGSPSKKDIVSLMVYDVHGREATKYLPYAEQSSADASFKSAALTNQSNYYSSSSSWDGSVVKTPYPFSKSVFEPSPLNKVLEQGAPGAAWQPAGSRTTTGRTIVFIDSINVANEVLAWTVTSTGATSAAYAANKLYKTVSKDENWISGKTGTSEEFKDMEGRVVLKRHWLDEVTSYSTYYAYDDLGNLRYVIPPAVTVTSFLESDPVFSDFIYGYHYDGKRRLIEKKIPGKGWEYMVYNKLDQLVLSQDALQASLGRWNFIKYDALARVIVTGYYSTGSSRSTLQGTLDLETLLWEARTGSGTGYTNDAYPQSPSYYYTINYYDDYTFYNNTFGSPVSPQINSPLTRGLLTGNRTTILGTGTMLLSVTYYDEYGRVRQSKSENHLNGTDVIDNTYNFAGELLTTSRSHGTGSESLYVRNEFSYDHIGRQKDTYQKTGQTSSTATNSLVLLSRNEYNEIGQLKKKSLHSTNSGSSFAQEVSYIYNERGWLSSQSAPWFSQSLKYNEPISGVTPQYNGNIERQEWAGSKWYNYRYDALSKLTDATSSMGNNEGIGYNPMGNIIRLQRKLGTILIDQMRYDYVNGNRLNAVIDSNASTNQEYQIAGTTGYDYDVNGNMVSRTNTNLSSPYILNNISSISYNHLNLPISMTTGSGTVWYSYDARGNKLKKVVGGSTTNDYIGGIQYEGGTIAFVATPLGRAIKIPGADPVYSYEYTLTDHLGNGRVYFDIYGGAARPIQETDYFAFGKAIQVGPVSGTENKYQFNGKELQGEMKMFDYGARFYDPVIGRWNVIDPLAEQYRRWSTFNYGVNNPLRFIDPDGMGVNDWVKKEDGTVSWEEDVTSKTDVDLDSKDTYIGKTGQVISSGKVSGTVNLNADGTATNATTGEFAATSVSGQTRIEDKFSGTVNAAGIASGTVGLAGDVGGYSTASYRLTNGSYNGSEVSPRLYGNGWGGGSRAQITTYSMSSLAKGISFGAGVAGTALSYYQIGSGRAQPLTYVDAGVGTAGIIASGASYFTGAQIPYVGEAVMVYGAGRLLWDVSSTLGGSYGPSKWFGKDDTKYFK